MTKNYLGLVLAFFLIFKSFAQEAAVVTVALTDSRIDSLHCTLSINSITRNNREIKLAKKNNVFTKNFALDNSTFIVLSDGKNAIEGIIEPEDNISISYNPDKFDSTLTFTGRGSRKFSLFREYKQALKVNLPDKLNSLPKGSKSLETFYAYVDSVESSLLKRLESITFSISSSSFNLLKGEIKGLALLHKYYGVERLLGQKLIKIEKSSTALSEQTKNDIKSLTQFHSSYYLSPQYLKAVYYVLDKEYEGMVAANKIGKGLKDKYNYLNSKLKDQLQIPVISMFMVADMEEITDQETIYSIITKTFADHSTSEFKPFIEKEYAMFRIGKKAPDFSLVNFDGKKVTLNDFRGKVIYVNFWFAGNTMCHNLFGKLRIVKDHFKDNPNVVFLTISIDSKELWFRTLTSYKIQGYHCYTEGKGLDHPVISAYKINKFPSTFVIDKVGNFYSTIPTDSPLQLISLIDNALSEPMVVENKRK